MREGLVQITVFTLHRKLLHMKQIQREKTFLIFELNISSQYEEESLHTIPTRLHFVGCYLTTSVYELTFTLL